MQLHEQHLTYMFDSYRNEIAEEAGKRFQQT